MPDPINLGRGPAEVSALAITPEEQAAAACLPRAAGAAEGTGQSPGVEQLVRRHTSVDFIERSPETLLQAAKQCIPELITASLTCAATSATAAPTLGASLVAASVCIGAGAAAGRCLANQTLASELRALEAAGTKTCEEDGGIPLAVRGDTVVCLMP